MVPRDKRGREREGVRGKEIEIEIEREREGGREGEREREREREREKTSASKIEKSICRNIMAMAMQSRAGMMTCDMARASPYVNFCAVRWRGIVNNLWGEEVGRATSSL